MSREIGSLRALSNGDSQYVGSSSGVFFINTVRKAFSTSAAAAVLESNSHGDNSGPSLSNPSPEDCIVGSEEQTEPCPPVNGAGEPNGNTLAAELNHHSPWGLEHVDDLSKLPNYAVARQLLMTYFQIWHPLAPFLHGPTCMVELDALYAGNDDGEQTGKPRSLSQAVIFRCIFNIAILDRQDLAPLGIVTIRSPSQILPALGLVTLKCDLASIQALLSAQVYLIATMALRAASSVGGLVTRSVVQSGLHRCPFRYWHLSLGDRDMRKRVFWSAYVLDRFLSQSLGHPLGIPDSDIDVCRPGMRDLHEPVLQTALTPSAAAEETILHLPANHPERRPGSVRSRSSSTETSKDSDDARDPGLARDNASDEPQLVSNYRREIQSVLSSHVQYSLLVGRLLEMFHKSIHVRSADSRAVLFLKADVHAWGNNLTQPRFSSGADGEGTLHSTQLAPDPSVFPFVSYQYSLLLLNRPSLSLDSDSAEFHSAIQICVGAGNAIIHRLERYSELGNPLFWPGYMSATWMSGLVLAFACQLRMCSASKAMSGISSALKLLEIMKKRWRMAGHCRSVLSTLLAGIRPKASGRKRDRGQTGSPQDLPPSHARHGSDVLYSGQQNGQHPSKRHRVSMRNGTQFSPSRHRSPSSQQVSSFNPFPYRPSTATLPSSSLACNEIYNQYGQSNHPLGSDGHDNWRRAYDEDPSFLREGSKNVAHPDMSFSEQFRPPNVDYSFGPHTQGDPSHPFLVPYPTQHHVPIPTTFPDRRSNGPYQNMAQTEGSASILDVFDGATWGSLLDLVDNSNEV